MGSLSQRAWIQQLSILAGTAALLHFHRVAFLFQLRFASGLKVASVERMLIALGVTASGVSG